MRPPTQTATTEHFEDQTRPSSAEVPFVVEQNNGHAFIRRSFALRSFTRRCDPRPLRDRDFSIRFPLQYWSVQP